VTHVPESELALFAFDPSAVSATRALEIQRHTASCAGCRETLDFFELAEGDLSDPDVWEPVTGSATRESLWAYAARIADEDREAEELLKPVLSAPAKTAWTDIATRKRFRTGGVVRRLNAHAHDICGSRPLDALIFAEAAISVAEALADNTYPAAAVYEMRGTAWKERANALIRLGRSIEALDSLVRAERAYRRLRSRALGLSTVALVRAAAFYQLQRLDDAAKTAAIAEHGFAHLGDAAGMMKALYLRGIIRYEAGDITTAAVAFRDVIARAEATNEVDWLAKGLCGLASCDLDRQNLGEASMHFQRALVLLREVAPESDDLVSAQWGIARVFLHAGKHELALKSLREVSMEFEKRGMVSDAALAGLDTAEALLVLGQIRSVADLATHVFTVFVDAGMLTGALAAIAYVKETATAGTLTVADLKIVRTFLDRSARQPDLVFAPPPPSSR
jgi:tetratricopeptide (TPR) repeat protein